MLGAQLLLCHGSVRRRRHSLTLFFVLSMAALLLYWLWFAYLKYGKQESEASKEVGNGEWGSRHGIGYVVRNKILKLTIIAVRELPYFQVSDTGRILTMLYLISLLPILLLYRALSGEKQNSDRSSADDEEIKSLM